MELDQSLAKNIQALRIAQFQLQAVLTRLNFPLQRPVTVLGDITIPRIDHIEHSRLRSHSVADQIQNYIASHGYRIKNHIGLSVYIHGSQNGWLVVELDINPLPDGRSICCVYNNNHLISLINISRKRLIPPDKCCRSKAAALTLLLAHASHNVVQPPLHNITRPYFLQACSFNAENYN
ncbi:hypothetical protein JFV28_14800 [Pseudomonas sp. TH05]|uniref:hypothetical protein n=1 Tax=unclassified Pseudomonas TaxID=196821 RepID=UPI0019143E4A|nr:MULTISPECIES: hypothetical protein [unclassified Pseudomonas]MBK5540716.1 hypothetical protein [Pseudomonas sp. TH07]MBK5557130.1 hypothetical protein [Pseudomonas sp. TH05]